MVFKARRLRSADSLSRCLSSGGQDLPPLAKLIVLNTLMHHGWFDVPRAGRASGAGKTLKTHGGQGICDVGVHLHNQSIAFHTWNTIAILHPSGHIWNVSTWCPIKFSWKLIVLKRVRFIVFCASRKHGNIIFVERRMFCVAQKL